MLHAALQGKVSINAGEDERGHITRINEDSLTSIVFGLMTYLPGELAWSLMQVSSSGCPGMEALPVFRFGRLEKAEFWPAWAPKGSNTRFTEPDVYLRFVMGDPEIVIDIIVEAKRAGWASQDSNQWHQQIEAYAETILAEGQDAPDRLFYFAVSGLDAGPASLLGGFNPPDISPEPEIVFANWTDFSSAARQMRDDGTPQTKRLMTMILQGLAKSGFVQRLYFDSLAAPTHLIFQRPTGELAT